MGFMLLKLNIIWIWFFYQIAG